MGGAGNGFPRPQEGLTRGRFGSDGDLMSAESPLQTKLRRLRSIVGGDTRDTKDGRSLVATDGPRGGDGRI